jgi:hypothetical protein
MRIGKKLFLIALILLGFLPGTAAAASGIEITPFGGFRFGGSFEDANTGDTIAIDEAGSYGLMLDFDLEPAKQIEVYLSRQSTKLSSGGTVTGNPKFNLTVDYYHIGGLLMLEGDRVRPFVSGTFGLTRMDPQGGDRTAEYFFSIALGGGAKIPLTERLGLRFDARGIFTAVNTNGTIFCANSGCAIHVQGGGVLQGELTAGLIFKF